MSKKDIARLQRLQNILARVITKVPRFSRFVTILKRLHWLAVKFRIHFKICTLTFRAQPTNLHIWLTITCSAKMHKNLRFTNSNRFVVPPYKNTKTRSRAFSVSGPALWNDLPVPIRNAQIILTLRKLLKSHLFDKAFPP